MSNPTNLKELDELEFQLATMRAQQMAAFISAGQYELAKAAGFSVYDTPAYLYLKRNLVTQDQAMLDLFLDVAILSIYTHETRPPILIQGESGTGKETFARAFAQGINAQGSRLPFVGINCTSLPDYLVESELFGHKKGAFTGAIDDRAGLLQTAGHGVVLIDEIGDMPLSLQPKLLRVLQERTIRRVGSNEELPIYCRIICATHRDLTERVNQKKFREDLLWRICSFEINIPPLRNRRSDALLYINQQPDLTVDMVRQLQDIVSEVDNTLGGNYRELHATINKLRLGMWRNEVKKV